MVNTLALGQQISMTPITKTDRHPSRHIPPETQAAEQEWAKAAQTGDSVAFMHLVDTYQRPVYNLCYRMLGDSTEAEDAAQETFLRAYTKLNTYQPSRKFSSWLFSIASHYCIDSLRKRRYHVVSWDDLPPWRMMPATDPEPEESTLQKERQTDLQHLLDSLPGDYRAAVVLRYWHEMPYDQIAETLNTTISAVKSRLFRARQMLAQTAQSQPAN
jgi:RNA polymerase sigma-70 factor (ECF subfamily)